MKHLGFGFLCAFGLPVIGPKLLSRMFANFTEGALGGAHIQFSGLDGLGSIGPRSLRVQGV